MVRHLRRLAGKGLRLLERLRVMVFQALKRPPSGPSIYRPHHYLLFELTPNYSNSEATAVHNSKGFRGPEIAARRPALRIVCIGESTTYCPGLAQNATWPAHLQAKLKASGLHDVEVINAGVPAYNSAEVLMSFMFKVEDLRPDLLIYYFTINDVRAREMGYVLRDYSGYCKIWGKRPPMRSLRDLEVYFRHRYSVAYQARLFLTHGKGEEAIFNTTADTFRANVRQLMCLAAGAGIKVLAILPRYRELTGATADFEADDPYSWAVAQHRQAVREVSLDFGHQVLDMIDKMPPPPWSKGEGSDTHYADSVHFTAKGAELFADIVANKILNSGIEGKSNVQGVD